MNFSILIDTPRLLPQPSLLLEGFKPETTFPLWQEVLGECVMALYSSIIDQLPIAANTHYRNYRYSIKPY